MLREKIQDPSLPSGDILWGWLLISNRVLGLLYNLAITLHPEEDMLRIKDDFGIPSHALRQALKAVQ